MELTHPLRLITPSLDGDLLEVLAGADQGFTGRELARLVDASQDGARRALARLVGQGVVAQQRAGSAYLYSLNRDHLAADHIVALADLRAELLRRLGSLLATWQPAVAYAALFGSVARGTERADSDLDVFLLRPDGVGMDDPRWARQVQALTSSVARWTGNDVRVLDVGVGEVADVHEPSGVLDDILQDGIALAGKEIELRRALRSARSRS